jgi:hypothetical protein
VIEPTFSISDIKMAAGVYDVSWGGRAFVVTLPEGYDINTAVIHDHCCTLPIEYHPPAQMLLSLIMEGRAARRPT